MGERTGMIKNLGNGMFNLVEANSYYGERTQAQMFLQDDILFIGEPEGSINALKSGSLSLGGVSKNVKKVINDKTIGLYLDFNSLGAMMGDLNGFDLDALEDMVFSLGGGEGEFKIGMRDKNTNSLKALFQWINSLYLKNKGQM